MRAIRVTQTGGPDVLRLAETDMPQPGPGEVRVRLSYAGVNFLDTYHRTGLYPVATPFTPGSEGAGVVDGIGPGVDTFAEGDAVAYASERGSYAEYTVVPASKLVPVPPGLPLDVAAAIMLQGMTAHYLACDTFPLESTHTALVHAAAGGVGLLLVQIARLRGARVIGTVSTETKAELARGAGAHVVVQYTRENFRERALEATRGRGVDVVYDAVGLSTWEESMRSLARRGMLVLYGNASGPVPPIDPLLLSRQGSLFLTRPTLAHYTAERAEMLLRCADLFGWLEEEKLRVHIDRVLPLDEAAEAHRLLEGRMTTGKVLLRI